MTKPAAEVSGGQADATRTALNIAEIPVFILCGGLGTRLKEMTEFRPKPMVTIGPDPILLHIMKHYSGFGFSGLCCAWATRARSSATTF
jgi:hypothetical protein